ncbi:MAG: flavin reductase family protein, partial [Porticoccaceae bacterium]|nr:flavin reductase family protein [Porticoccaceae bacterium]
CSLANQYDGGDHVIIVGKVLELSDHGLNPLIFHRGGYESL